MEKKEVKNILMSMRTPENDEMINKLLGKIDIMDEQSFRNILKQIGETEEKIRDFLNKKISEKQSEQTQEHIHINEMFSYGISENCIHLHLPVDLHQMFSEKGISKTFDTVNLYLLDAIDKIKDLKDNGYYKFEGKDSIYMISPILSGREIRFLDGLDFETRMYRKKELSSEEFVKENPEAMLATYIFGKDKNVGTAKIKFDKISSKEWQNKKQDTIKSFKNKGIILNYNTDIEK